MISLALFEPEIPQNTGTLMRLCACFNMTLHIIEPCGYLWNDKKLHRSVMDYQKIAHLNRHLSFDYFLEFLAQKNKRLILIDVDGDHCCWDFQYQEDDVLLLGKESSGVPESVRKSCTTSISIPQKQGRSLNIATAASIVIGESIRYTKAYR
ncbi:MAG: tRNA (cytidine(34)-2'-O)-methyltransferase [Holosporales bacterium]